MINFTPSAVAPVSRENGTRERKPAREARAKAMFAAPKSIRYVGPVVLPVEAATALKAGQEIGISGQPVSAGKPGILACVICQGTHGSAANFHNRADLVALTTVYETVATKTFFSLSDSCRQDYFGLYADKVLVNPVDYRAHFPKAVVKG